MYMTKLAKDIKRIAFVHERFPLGGAERVTFDLANFLAEHDFEVYVFTHENNVGFYPRRLPVKFIVKVLPEKRVDKSECNAQVLAEWVRTLHLDFLVAVVNPLLLIRQIIPQGSHCKYIIANHGMPFWECVKKDVEKRIRWSRTWLGTLAWWMIQYPCVHFFKVYERRYLKRYRSVYEEADAYTVLCEEYKNTLIKKMHLNPRYNKIWVTPNSEREAPPELRLMHKEKQVLYVGRMSYADKRVDRLLRIWNIVCRKNVDWELILVGDGEERLHLEDMAKKLHLERIRFVGSDSQVEQYYSKASILCLTSSLEGWGLVLTEAQAHGVIPIAFDCSAGVNYILSPSGEHGFLVPPFDIRRYANELLRLMKDDALRSKMRLQVMQKAQEYRMDIVGERWLTMLKSLE